MYINSVQLTHWITLQLILQLVAEAILLNTGPISKIAVIIIDLDTNRLKVEKGFPLL